jgi:hypothetical protein
MDYSLSDKWVLWAHLPHDTDWSLKSYYKIHSFDDLKDSILLNHSFSDDFIRNCMLFLMKDNINPIWEDPNNKNGGCFSFKVNNKDVPAIWKILFYTLVGDTLSNDNNFLHNICGITISPKKTFCIIKIWTRTCNYQNPTLLNNITGLNISGCIFKKHIN